MTRQRRMVRVRAADGMRIPGKVFGLPMITSETFVEVPYTAMVRRALACGDFVEVEGDSSPAPDAPIDQEG